MARRMTRQRKIEPAVLNLTFIPEAAVPVGLTLPDGSLVPGTRTYYIDTMQSSSLVNRRFYRQGMLVPLSGLKVLSQSIEPLTGFPALIAPSGAVAVHKLPSTWVLSNSWEKSFRTWTRMNSEALSETPSVRPKFLDFKIYADPGHHASGFAGNLVPRSGSVSWPSGSSSPATVGEWESSKVIVPKTNGTDDVSSFEIIACGQNYPGISPVTGKDAVSMIEGYAASRGLPNVLDPNVPGDADDASGTQPENWMQALHNDGTEQTEVVLADMVSENNLAPYPFENDGTSIDTMYPNGANQLYGLEIHDFDRISGTTIGGVTRLQGGAFPCGLVKIVVTNNSLTNELKPTIQLSLMPGDHRGLLLIPMQDM